MLPGKLLEQAGIHDSPYFALTQVLAPQLAGLSRAPGAPQPEMTAEQKVVDHDMASVSLLRLKGKLEALLPPQAVVVTSPAHVAGAAPTRPTALGTTH
jgi:hypothetical protein